MRDLLIELAASGLFRAKWTDDIHEEWIGSLLESRTDLRREQLERTRQLMDRAVPDCVVTHYQPLIDSLTLPDPDDRHVLAAAIHAGADGIVTFNGKDFPADYLATFELERLHPDEFVFHQFGLDSPVVIVAAQRCRARLHNAPRTAGEYLDALEKLGLPQTVAELRKYSEVI